MICFDGPETRSRPKDNTNVVRLFSLLELTDPERQVTYYDPGVGTLGSSRSWTPWAQAITRVLGLGFGMGLRENLGEAYAYLMSQYEDGDHLYILGFSRGAYTARALCGMLLKLGLLRDGSQNLVPICREALHRQQPRLGQAGPVRELHVPQARRRPPRCAGALPRAVGHGEGGGVAARRLEVARQPATEPGTIE